MVSTRLYGICCPLAVVYVASSSLRGERELFFRMNDSDPSSENDEAVSFSRRLF